MTQDLERMDVRVTDITSITPLVKRFTLARDDGRPLPAFTGGSHINVHMEGEAGQRYSNAYSLLGAPAEHQHYRIGVQLEVQGNGGSAFMHQRVQVGSRLWISPPNNLFALHAEAGRHLLIAGGIGITPFLAHLHELHARVADYELHYAFRNTERGAFLDALAEARHGGRVHLYPGHEGKRLDLPALVAQLQARDHLYVCGPPALIDATLATARAAGIAEARLHWERFSAAPQVGHAFTLVLARSGRELRVEAGTSILTTIQRARAAPVESLCRAGICGSCETRILEGEALHLDQYLSDDEKAAQRTLMLCVSRARGERLVLDL
ncbi:ferredoxin-NADP reductase [Pseudomonas alcaligenes]|nr:ferredoxin-NADP reductase [Pseudomonas alcaligenes]